jgi:hypothetical protein
MVMSELDTDIYCSECGESLEIANTFWRTYHGNPESLVVEVKWHECTNHPSEVIATRQMVERLIEAGKKLSIIALLNTREDIETWERWHALVAEWQAQDAS